VDNGCSLKHLLHPHSLGSVSFNLEDNQPNPAASITSCSTSPLPGFSQFYRSVESSNEKKREDGTSLFSPSCFSPGFGFSNFGTGYDLFAEGRHRDEKGKEIPNPNISSDLSRDYAQLISSKREIGE
jgi:hypothetical protein